jgi:hypothetical protein
MRFLLPTFSCAITLLAAPVLHSQTVDASPTDTVRVNVTINPDQSRTVYEFDAGHRKATATTSERDGKLRGKIVYELDDANRFARGQVFGPDGRFRFNSLYKYDSSGRLQEEIQRKDDNALLARIVYSYDAAGKQTGYSIFDGSGKLVGRVGGPTASPAPKSRKGSR